MAPADARHGLDETRFHHIEWVLETGSTNRDLLDLAADGGPEGVVRATDHQTAGRGRRDRSWHDPPGASLLVSVLLRPDLPPARLHLLTLGFAIAAASAAGAQGATLGVKWPNDLIDPDSDRKVAGILAESRGQGSTIDVVVIGMGMNCNWADPVPDDLAATASSLRHLSGHEIDRSRLLIDLLCAFDVLYEAAHHDPDALRARYRAVTATLGREVRVELDGRSVVGIAADVTVEGHLIVRPAAGDDVVVTVGDVVHLRPTDRS